MIKTAWQLKDRIRNLAKSKSADAQVLMRNYMMERFLERISVSEYRDKFILKGGMLVAAMIGLESRATMDIDGTIKGLNVNVEDVEKMIATIVSVPMDDGVEVQVKRISEIMDEAEYPGRHLGSLAPPPAADRGDGRPGGDAAQIFPGQRLLELRRPGRDPPGGSRSFRGGRGVDGGEPLFASGYRRYPGSGPHNPSRRGIPYIEFPSLAECLR